MPEVIYLSRDRLEISLNLFGEDRGGRVPASELDFNLLANRLPEVGLVFFRNSVQRIFLDLLRTRLTGQGQDDMFRKEEIRSDGGRIDLVWVEQGLLLLFALRILPVNRNAFHQPAAGASYSRSQPSN